MLVRELMALSWHPNPDIRPDMKQCKKWTSSDEFVRLRANFTLSDVSSVACACVSHIDLNKLMLLQPTEETDSSLKVNHHSEILQPQQVHEEEKELENWEIVDGTISAADSTTKSGGEIQPATPDEIKDVPDPRVGRSNSRKETQKTRITEKDIDLYTQIWMCGKDRKKGLFSTFLFPDNQKSNYVSFSGGGVCITWFCFIVVFSCSLFGGPWAQEKIFIRCASFVTHVGWAPLRASCVSCMPQQPNYSIRGSFRVKVPSPRPF